MNANPTTPLRPIEFHTMAALLEAPAHGYGLVKQIESQTEGRFKVRPGDLYRVLYRLAERGWIATDPHPSDACDERRNSYRITSLGRKVLEAEAQLLYGMARRIVAVAEEGGS